MLSLEVTVLENRIKLELVAVLQPTASQQTWSWTLHQLPIKFQINDMVCVYEVGLSRKNRTVKDRKVSLESTTYQVKISVE